MVGEPHFFVFLDAADRMAIGEKSYYQAKVYFHAKVRGFRDSMGFYVIVYRKIEKW